MTIRSLPSLKSRRWRLAASAEAGGKGVGLLRLPPDWYPPTLVLPAAEYDEAKNGDALRCVVSDAELAEVANVLQADRLLVRSSAVNEGIGDRGRYKSVETSTTPTDIRSAVEVVWASLSDPGSMAVLVQPHFHARLSGHMSNEHRVARDKLTWFCEYSDGRSSQNLRVHGVAPADEGPLSARSERALVGILRKVARWLGSAETRVHVEWVWDGTRLWIVQADDVPALVGAAPGEAFVPRRGRRIQPESLSLFQSVEFSTRELLWPKIARVADFRRANLPTVPLYLLRDTDALRSLADQGSPDGIMDDIELLTEGDLVMRCDITSATAPSLMLPRTETENNPLNLLGFMQTTVRSLINGGAELADICFVAHRYLRARACAWSFSQPLSSTVRVDATWGIIDGLAWVPFDSYWVSPEETKRRIRPKTSFLDANSNGNWSFRESPTDWIWANAARDEQLELIAEGARRLAQEAGHAIVTMWFLDLLDDSATVAMPWFQMAYDIDPQATWVSPERSPRRSIASVQDIRVLASSLTSDNAPDYMLLLRPSDETLRDTGLLGEVAQLAIAHNLTVEIEGSPLGHPFYELRRLGVNVVCRFDDLPESISSSKTRHGKLVRDGIPDAIAAGGEQVLAYRTSREERGHWLRSKAIEEAIELYWAQTKEAQIGELADLQEVVSAFTDWLELTADELAEAALRKRSKRGAFEAGLVLIDTWSDHDAKLQATQLALPGMPNGVRWASKPLPHSRSSRSVGGVRIPYYPAAAVDDDASFFLGGTEIVVRYTPNGIELKLVHEDPAQLSLISIGRSENSDMFTESGAE